MSRRSYIRQRVAPRASASSSGCLRIGIAVLMVAGCGDFVPWIQAIQSRNERGSVYKHDPGPGDRHGPAGRPRDGSSVWRSRT